MVKRFKIYPGQSRKQPLSGYYLASVYLTPDLMCSALYRLSPDARKYVNRDVRAVVFTPRVRSTVKQHCKGGLIGYAFFNQLDLDDEVATHESVHMAIGFARRKHLHHWWHEEQFATLVGQISAQVLSGLRGCRI